MLSGKSKKNLQAALVVPGAIVHIFCSFIQNPHPKFVVIAHVDTEDDLVLGFFINSNIHPLVQANPDKLVCQVPLTSNPNHTFLDRDSFINCSEVQDGFSYSEIVDHLVDNPKDYKGRLLEKEIMEVCQVVQATRLIGDYDKDLVMESLGK